MKLFIAACLLAVSLAQTANSVARKESDAKDVSVAAQNQKLRKENAALLNELEAALGDSSEESVIRNLYQTHGGWLTTYNRDSDDDVSVAARNQMLRKQNTELLNEIEAAIGDSEDSDENQNRLQAIPLNYAHQIYNYKFDDDDDASLAKENQALLQQNAKLMEAVEAAVGKKKRKKRKKDSKESESEDDQEQPEEPEAPEQPEEPEAPEQPEEPEAPEQPEEPEAPEQPEEMECKKWCKNNFSRNCRKKKDDCGGCQECSALASGTVSDSVQTAVNADMLRYAVIFFATVGAFTVAYYISKAIFKMVNGNNGFQAIKDIEIWARRFTVSYAGSISH